MTRSLVRVAAAAGLVGIGLLGPAGAAHATTVPTATSVGSGIGSGLVPARADCEIALDDDLALVAAADDVDAVFVGTVAQRPRPVRGGTGTTTDRGPGAVALADASWRHLVAVEADYTGFVRSGTDIKVTVTEDDGPTEARLRKGSTYLFLASGQGDRVVVSTCGVIEMPNGLTDRVDRRLVGLLAPPTPQRDDPQLTLVPGADEDPPAWGRMVAPGGAVALIGVLGLALVSRLGRERR